MHALLDEPVGVYTRSNLLGTLDARTDCIQSSTVVYTLDLPSNRSMHEWLTGYWGREPFLFDAVFIYARAQSKPQPAHRDVALMELAPVSLLFDISPTAITTMFIAKSHRLATPSPKLAVRLSTQHNAVLFNCFIEHHGAATVVQSCKLSLTFIPRWRDEHERQCYAEHSYAFGVSDKDTKLKGQTLPLIPLRRLSSSI
jgi:hypothetical protein